MSAPHPMAYDFFYKNALEYYVNGRASAFCGCLFTTGNLLHHAVEMMLKGELSRTVSLEDLKDNKKVPPLAAELLDGLQEPLSSRGSERVRRDDPGTR